MVKGKKKKKEKSYKIKYLRPYEADGMYVTPSYWGKSKKKGMKRYMFESSRLEQSGYPCSNLDIHVVAKNLKEAKKKFKKHKNYGIPNYQGIA